MKKFMCMVLTVVLLVSLAGCSSRASAESVVEDAIQAFQSADVNAMRQYWGNTELTSSQDTTEDDAYAQQMLEQLASGLTYQITDSSEDTKAGTATVTVEFTNIDMSTVFSEWMGEIFSKALGYAFLPADQQPSEEELSDLSMEALREAVENHADDKVTNTVDIPLSLVENEWKIDTSDEVIDAMTGGMMTAFSSLDEAEGTSETPAEPVRTNPAVLGDYTVEIQSATITQDYEGNPAVVIDYSWTNNSSETTSPLFSVTTAVFQDGVGLESALITADSVYDSSMHMADVRPGTTIEVQEAFSLYNTTSPIEVEITEAFAWDDPAEIAYMTFTLT